MSAHSGFLDEFMEINNTEFDLKSIIHDGHLFIDKRTFKSLCRRFDKQQIKDNE